MAIEIDTAYSDEPVVLEGEDARRFMDELVNPSSDPRRLEHLRESREAFERIGPIRDANEIFSQKYA